MCVTSYLSKYFIKFSALHVNNEGIKILVIDFFLIFIFLQQSECFALHFKCVCMSYIQMFNASLWLVLCIGPHLASLDVHGVVDGFNGPH